MSGQGVGDEGLAASFNSPPAEVAALYDEWAQADYDADLDGWGYDAPQRVASTVADRVAQRVVGGSGVLDAGSAVPTARPVATTV